MRFHDFQATNQKDDHRSGGSTAIFVAGISNMNSGFDVTSVYECPVCRAPDLRDFGLHLLLKHNLFFCYHCTGFFGSIKERDKHLRQDLVK